MCCSYPNVDAGGGWLIFKLPPAEVAVHPAEGAGSHELYLMCDNVNATIEELSAKGVTCGPVSDAGLGPADQHPAARWRGPRPVRAASSEGYGTLKLFGPQPRLDEGLQRFPLLDRVGVRRASAC